MNANPAAVADAVRYIKTLRDSGQLAAAGEPTARRRDSLTRSSVTSKAGEFCGENGSRSSSLARIRPAERNVRRKNDFFSPPGPNGRSVRFKRLFEFLNLVQIR